MDTVEGFPQICEIIKLRVCRGTLKALWRRLYTAAIVAAATPSLKVLKNKCERDLAWVGTRDWEKSET